MSARSLRELCAQVSRELGVEIAVPVGEDDGLELPFATIFPRVRFSPAADGWVRVGCDNYFSDFLRRNDSFAVWDREMGGPVEATHGDLVELLADVYADYLDGGVASLIVSWVPGSLERVVAILKPVTSMRTVDLLAALRSAPVTFGGIDCAAGILAVRELHALGVDCHLTDVRD
ncbi:MAG TPA: hypothetical protein VFC19_27880 [Candidatus Limnocylindrales bacterium]|nr:hypothetical protein [Candidatus Limnocylindrales bacterium]